MKSSILNLRKRGYIDDLDLKEYENYSSDELLLLLNSKEAYKRSIGAKLLSNFNKNNDFTPIFLEKLKTEKSIYTRLIISKSLECGDVNTLKLMFDYISIIGTNQHKKLPKLPSKKKSYPLPRDIISRIIGKMSPTIFPTLLNELLRLSSMEDIGRLSELVDAIGFMAFYNKNLVNEDNLNIILKVLKKFEDNELVLWKFTICLSAFPLDSSFDVLNNLKNSHNSLIKNEAIRSLSFF